MAWGVSINRPHLLLWRRLAVGWLAYVGVGLVLGAALKPRPDEVAFVLTLPLVVIVPYALGCLALAGLKAYLWPIRFQGLRLILHTRLLPKQGVGTRTGR